MFWTTWPMHGPHTALSSRLMPPWRMRSESSVSRESAFSVLSGMSRGVPARLGNGRSSRRRSTGSATSGIGAGQGQVAEHLQRALDLRQALRVKLLQKARDPRESPAPRPRRPARLGPARERPERRCSPGQGLPARCRGGACPCSSMPAGSGSCTRAVGRTGCAFEPACLKMACIRA